MLAKIGTAAYKLQLPDNSQVHPFFHVSQLKPFTPNYTPVFHELPKLINLDNEKVEPMAILQRRLVKKGNTAVPQVLVRWSHLPADATTWEDYNVLQKAFPAASAWGQAQSQGGGDVRTNEEEYSEGGV